jgi:2-polyprenyl-6-hydroxyphenyl methylase/3-demethylubiquinone-9 3-methyltransferase
MNSDIKEIGKFNNLAQNWWDINGELKTLHHINPIRLEFIKAHTSLANQSVLDVGCGGGILSEALAQQGAIVTGIDLANQAIEIAKLHLYESKLNINYHCEDIKDFASKSQIKYDIITCLELLEHVPDPEYIIEHCSTLLKPGGVAFFSTLNRNLTSYLLGVIAAEYLLKIVPRGTHDYAKFIKPSELNKLLQRHNLQIMAISGIGYNPINATAYLTSKVNVNYILCCKKINGNE